MSPDGTTTDPCGPNPCGPCSRCSEDHRCVDGQWQCDCVCADTSTGEPPPPPDRCPTLEDVVLDWVSPSKTPPVDCGTVDRTDGNEAWLAVQTCVIEQHDLGAAYYAIWTYPETVSGPYQQAVAARAGALYEEAWFDVSGFYTLTRSGCEAVQPPFDCLAFVEDMCLTCINPDRGQILCDLK